MCRERTNIYRATGDKEKEEKDLGLEKIYFQGLKKNIGLEEKDKGLRVKRKGEKIQGLEKKIQGQEENIYGLEKI